MSGIHHPRTDPRTDPVVKALVAVLLAIATLVASTALATAPAQAAGSTVVIRPESLPRGAEVRGAHMATPTSRTIVDGDVKVTVPGTFVDLLGTSGTSYVVFVVRDQRSSVLRVGPGGSERVVVADAGLGVVLASDGGLLAVTRSTSNRSTTIDIVRVSTGRTVLRHRFPGGMDVLDVRGSRAIIGSFDGGAYSWDLSTDRTTLLTRRASSAADLRTGLLATYDKDPYDGGCTVLTTIAQPQRTLWRSCSERIQAFSPDGQRIATVFILSDGVGPGRVVTRSIRGNLLASYQASPDQTGGYFGEVRWESDKALLLDTYGRTKTATVRCTGSTCVRASALTTSPSVRPTLASATS